MLDKESRYIFNNNLYLSPLRIKILNLEANKIRDSGMIHLCSGMRKNRSIKILNISCNELTDKCTQHLEDMLSHNYSLRELYIR